MTRFGSVLAAAVLAVATTVLPGLSVAPAEAAACSDAGGVTVVVDGTGLTGSLSQTCVGGSGKATALFGDAGHTLTRVQRFPGAVCKVDGEPADSSCVNMPPTNAYWGLFWSDGKSGSWAYSSAGVDNLEVPAGGSVALAWQSSNGRRNPAAEPPDHDGSGTDDPGGGSGGGTGGSSGGGRTGGPGGGVDAPTGGPSSDAPQSSSPSASDSPTSDAPKPADGKQAGKRDRDGAADDPKRERPREQQSQTAKPTEGATVSPDAAPADDVATTSMSQDGLPLWLVGLAAAGLLAVGTTVAVVRRRATHDA
jgi:hypothetical protein